MVNLGYITVVLANTLVAYATVGFHEFGGRLNWQVRFVCPNAEIERFLALFLFFQPANSFVYNQRCREPFHLANGFSVSNKVDRVLVVR